jgi:HSF-type DNA-binding
MIALTHVERECAKEKRPESEESIGWVLDGKAFVVQNIDRFCETWLPMFFGQAKFSSFTRKLYRWGFRKINIASIPNRKSYSENALFFGSAHFLRDDKSQLSLMRSVTAAKTRSSVAADALKQAWTPTESHESATEDSKPKARQEQIPVDVTNSNTAYQQTNLTLTGHVGGENVSVLLQQAVNLAALQSLLQSNQHADRTTSQSPIFIGNHMMDESLRRQLTQQQNPPILQVDMFQALQQLALSAALTASGSISHTTQRRPQAPAVFIPQTFGTLPSLINSTIPVTHVNGTMQTNQQARGWSSEGHLLDARLPVSHDPAEEERLRRVIEAFLQYCRSVQQRQDAPSLDRNPRAPPP